MLNNSRLCRVESTIWMNMITLPSMRSMVSFARIHTLKYCRFMDPEAMTAHGEESSEAKEPMNPEDDSEQIHIWSSMSILVQL